MFSKEIIVIVTFSRDFKAAMIRPKGLLNNINGVKITLLKIRGNH